MTPCQSKYIRGGQILWVLSQTVVSHDAVQSGWPSSWCWGSGGAGFLPMSLGVLGKASAARCRRWEHITTRTRKHYWKTCISTNKRLFYMFYLLLSGYPFESQKQYYCWYFRSVLSLSLPVARYWRCGGEQRQPGRGDQTEDQDERIPELGPAALPDHLHRSADQQVVPPDPAQPHRIPTQRNRNQVDGWMWTFTVSSCRRSEVVALQHFLCAGCGTEVEPREYSHSQHLFSFSCRGVKTV